ncbi:unnamed protein product, partial [Brenthis ino]
MKVIFVFMFVTLCSQIVLSNSAHVSGASVSSTTAKPWARKFKDGASKFLEGAAIVSAVQGVVQNGRGSRHKSSHPFATAHKN